MQYQNLIGGDFPQARGSVTIGVSQTLKAGSVLGKKTVTAGAKGVFSFLLSSLTAAEGSVTLSIDALTYTVSTTTESTLSTILTALAAAVNADSESPFVATADTANSKLVLTANTVGTWANDSVLSLASSGITLTIGSKVTVTSGVDFSDGSHFLVDSSKSDGTQTAVCVLLEDVTTGADATAQGVVARTGEFVSDSLIFGGTDTVATHIDAMRARCLFPVSSVPVAG